MNLLASSLALLLATPPLHSAGAFYAPRAAVAVKKGKAGLGPHAVGRHWGVHRKPPLPPALDLGRACRWSEEGTMDQYRPQDGQQVRQGEGEQVRGDDVCGVKGVPPHGAGDT